MQASSECVHPVLHVGQTHAWADSCHVEPATIIDDGDMHLPVAVTQAHLDGGGPAYFCTFWSASRVQKYRAASISCWYPPMPSAWMWTGALRACDSNATTSPLDWAHRADHH